MKKILLLLLATSTLSLVACTGESEDAIDEQLGVASNDSIPVPQEQNQGGISISIDTAWAGGTVINFDKTDEWGAIKLVLFRL